MNNLKADSVKINEYNNKIIINEYKSSNIIFD